MRRNYEFDRSYHTVRTVLSCVIGSGTSVLKIREKVGQGETSFRGLGIVDALEYSKI